MENHELNKVDEVSKGVKNNLGKTLDFLNQNKVKTIIVGVLFLFILISSTMMRTQNAPLLVDSTSGERILIELDSHYFLRVAEAIAQPGPLPEYDAMRAPLFNTPWIPEMLPRVLVGMYEFAKIFNSDIKLADVSVFSPVIFFFIGLIIFFFMCASILKSKVGAVIASALIAFYPAYLYRTIAGFADHDSLGMVAVFACFLLFSIGLNNYDKSWKRGVIFGLLTGFATTLAMVFWGGAVTFILLVIPATFFLNYLFNSTDKLKSLIFYFSWIIGAILLQPIFGYAIMDIVTRMLSSYGLLVPFVLAFIIIDYTLKRIERTRSFINERYHEVYAFIITAILGVIGLTILGKNILHIISDIIFKLIRPFESATGRLGSTVAENAQPFLSDWMGQMGKPVFFVFLLGLFIIGLEVSKGITRIRHKILFNLSWIILICTLLFSRISADSLMNGTNFISQFVYFAGLLIFSVSLVYIFFKDKFKADSSVILILGIALVTLVYGRSASRIFFLISPFLCMIIAYGLIKSFDYMKSKKEELQKLLFACLFIAALLVLVFSLKAYYLASNNQAKYTGPSMGEQWQESAAWIRNSTPENSLFVHWWDYGYWIESVGKRPAVTDGGHAGGDDTDHYIGRYILTTPNPDSALSFMKTWDVTHLLIDQTDLGKYPAYSKIGSDLEWDRMSMIPVGIVDNSQTRETSNSTVRVYQVSGVVDEDIMYNDIFLPGPTYNSLGNPSYKSYILGIILEVSNDKSGKNLQQPQGVFMYNGKQVSIPIRYVYFNGELLDFKTGLNATMRIMPAVTQASNGGASIDVLGSAIYLSPRVNTGLFARLYLMNDKGPEYAPFKLVNSADDYVVKILKSQGTDMGDMIYYQGFRGPIKIWEIDYPTDIKAEPEFIDRDFKFADMDYLFY